MAKKIVVLGAGSIGTYVGGRLLSSSAEITFLGRERLQKAVQANGLNLSDCHGFQQRIPSDKVNVSTDESVLSEADIILVAVKSKDTPTSAETIKQYARADALVVSLQNGIYNADRIAEICPQQVLAGMVPFNVVWRDNASFHQGTEGHVIIESRDGLEADLKTIFKEANYRVGFHREMKNVMWSKLLLNMSNGVNCLAGVPLLTGLSNTSYRRAMALCMSEAISLLRKAGIKTVAIGGTPVVLVPYVLRLPTPLFRVVAKAMLTIDPNARSSMLDDLEQGREPEVDYINGEVVRLAEQLGLSAPVNTNVCQLVMAAHESGQGSPNIPLSELDQIIRQ